jgi:hypothetical protein
MAGAADGDEAEAAQVANVERLHQSMRLKPIEGQPDFLPFGSGNEIRITSGAVNLCVLRHLAIDKAELDGDGCAGFDRFAADAHAVVLLDQAGWHVAKDLVIPGNITLMPLPPRAPELNPVENVWQFLRDNWLSNRIFPSYDDILDHCCAAWNKLVDQPWKIISIGLRDWAHAS